MTHDAVVFVLCLVVMAATFGAAGGLAFQKHRYATRCEPQPNRTFIAAHQMKDSIYCVWSDSDGAIRKEKAK